MSQSELSPNEQLLGLVVARIPLTEELFAPESLPSPGPPAL